MEERSRSEPGSRVDAGREASRSADGRAGADLDGVRRRLALMEEFLAWRRLVERSRAGDPTAGDAGPRADEEDSRDPDAASREVAPEIAPEMEWMRRAQRALVSHPVATQSAFVALAREGRAFADSEDGRAWARVLQDAPAVQRLRTLWEAANFTLTADEQNAPLPSAMIELFVRAAASGEVDEIAARLGLPFLDSPAASKRDGAEEAAE